MALSDGGNMPEGFVAAAHELKAPLALISGLAATLQEQNVSEAERTQAIERIILSSDRLLELVEGFLAAERYRYVQQDDLELTALSPVCIMEDVAHELSPLAETYQQHVELQPPRRATTIMVHRPSLHRVLFNLLDNAIKYSKPQSTIGLEARCERDRHVRLTVKDNGTGVASADIKRIFEKFGTAMQPVAAYAGSSGLGLYIAEQLTKAMQGSIGVHAQRGGGSAFYVRVPIAQQINLFATAPQE